MIENSIEITGKSNTGKTMKVLFEETKQEIEKGNNLVFLDSKEEYYNNFGKYLIDNGYDIKVINFNNPLKSDGWDPIEYISSLYKSGNVDKAVEMCKNVGQVLLKANVAGDPFWENTGADYLTGLILALNKISIEKSDNDICNFGSVYNMINSADIKYNSSTILKEYCNTLNTMDPAYISLSSVAFLPSETRGGVLGVVKEHINPLFMRPTLLNSFYNNNFKVSSIPNIKKKTAIFVIAYQPLEKLANILIEQIYDIAVTSNVKFTFILDNFDMLNGLSCIENMITSANEKKIKLYLTMRNKEKVMSKYDKYTFDDIEKRLELTEEYEKDIENKVYPLPTLKNEEAKYIDFELYVKENIR